MYSNFYVFIDRLQFPVRLVILHKLLVRSDNDKEIRILKTDHEIR